MKRIIIYGILFMITITATVTWGVTTKVELPDSCAVCGMSRPGFAQSRMLITYEDGTTFGTCSIACVSGELAKKEKKVKGIQVGDYTTEKLIDAKSAIWVINAKRRGIMSAVAKKLAVPFEKFIVTVDHCGNLSAASIPVALDEAVNAGKIKSGDTVLLVAFGGGFTWGSMIVKI